MLKFVVVFVSLAIVLAEDANEEFSIVKRLKPSSGETGKVDNTGVPDIDFILGTDEAESSDENDISFILLGDESEGEKNGVNLSKSSDFQYAIVPSDTETNKGADKNNDKPDLKNKADESESKTDEPKVGTDNSENETSKSKEGPSSREHEGTEESEKNTQEQKEVTVTPESKTNEPIKEFVTVSPKQNDQKDTSSSEEEEDQNELISESKTSIDSELDEKHQKEIESIAESFGTIVSNALKKFKCDKQRLWAGLLINDVLLQGMNGKLTENTTVGQRPTVHGPFARKVPVPPYRTTKSPKFVSSFFMPLRNNDRDTHIGKFGIPEILKLFGIKPFPLFDDLFPFPPFPSLFDLK